MTDIERSSALWEADENAMAASLAAPRRADRALRREPPRPAAEDEGRGRFHAHGLPARVGRARVRGRAARVAGRCDLARATSTLRVRVALHTGEANERGGDYFGPALNRTARLRAIADGGTTLLSQATRELVHDHLPPAPSSWTSARTSCATCCAPSGSSSCARPTRRGAHAGTAARDPQDRHRIVRVPGGQPGRRADPEARRRESAPGASGCAHGVRAIRRRRSRPVSGRRADGGLRRAATARGRRASGLCARPSSCAACSGAAARASGSPPAR